MTPRAPDASRERDHASPFRRFRRARRRLWMLSLLGVLAGAVLHDLVARSLGARLLWLGAVATSLGHPLRSLLAFRCPRCGGVFLATGGWRDFLGLGRILWAKQCGRCALSLVEEEPPSSEGLPASRTI